MNLLLHFDQKKYHIYFDILIFAFMEILIVISAQVKHDCREFGYPHVFASDE